MTKKNIYILSAASFLVIVLIVIVIVRKRGRKVYLKEKYRLNNSYSIWINDNTDGDVTNSIYYNGLLDYVVVDNNATPIDGGNGKFYFKINAVGEQQMNGKIKRRALPNPSYIESYYLDI